MSTDEPTSHQRGRLGGLISLLIADAYVCSVQTIETVFPLLVLWNTMITNRLEMGGMPWRTPYCLLDATDAHLTFPIA